MMQKRKDLDTLVVSMVLAIFTLTSCDKEPRELRPELPPVESLVMDYSDFADAPAGMKSTLPSYKNFVLSYTLLSYWSAAATLVSALPVAAYSHALTSTPEYVGDNTWEWSFDFTFDQVDYVCTLTGTRINNEEFSVEMVTAEASAPDLKSLWLDGVARYDHTSAFWTLYEEGNTAVLEIEWNKDFETEEADLTYTYVKPDQTETGSFIRWIYLPEEVYDAAYTLSMSENTTHIEWNLSTIEGRVKSPAFFGDDNWYCWDSFANGLADIACE